MAAPETARPPDAHFAVRRSALLFLLSRPDLRRSRTADSSGASLVAELAACSAHPHAAHITEASRRFGIPPAWIIAVMRARPPGDVRAVSSAGAMSLMQVMPDMGRASRPLRLGRNRMIPRDNILAGTAYLPPARDVGSLWRHRRHARGLQRRACAL